MACYFSRFTIAIVTVIISEVMATNQHMICKALEDVFSEGTDILPSARSRDLHGPAGKRGPQGIKGSKGERGIPGTVEPQDVERTVQEILNSATKDLRDRIGILEKQVAELNSTSLHQREGEDAASISCEGVVYNRKCYFAVLHQTRDVPLENAKQICIGKQAKLADIVNLEHEELIIEYLRPQVPSGRSDVQIWLGMLYATSTRTLQSSDRRNVIPSLKWYQSYPDNDSSHNVIGMLVSSTRSDDGLFNFRGTYSTQGCLCEKYV